MSHRKASKRRREASGDDDFSPTIVPQKKQSKSQKAGFESPQQNVSVDDSDGSVRRSSRTPKPKVFDDEETAVIAKTPEASKSGDAGLIPATESSSSTNIQQRAQHSAPNNEATISKRQRMSTTGTSTYVEGHKRETRRSYQDYLKELKTETGVVQTRSELESVEQTKSKSGQNNRDRNITKISSAKRKSEAISADVTPKGTRVMHKTPNVKSPSNIRVKRETPDEASPKVRSSSRTPVPKKVFSLLEDEGKEDIKSEVSSSPGVESESINLTSPKVRASSRAHMPKKSFPLLEKGDTKETKQATPEQTSSKTRTSQPHSSKRQFSAEEEESRQNKLKNTPVTSEEASPRVRVSSRGHKPKRTFSLLEGDEVPDESKGGRNDPEKVLKDEKYVLSDLIANQKALTTKETKRRKSSSGELLNTKPRPSSKESSTCEDKKQDPAHVPVKVERLEVSRGNGTVTAADNTDVKTPNSAKLTPGRKRSLGAKEDEDQGRASKRKGKPVKKKTDTPEQASMLDMADVKVKVEPELVSLHEALTTPKTAKSKSASKKKQATESSVKQSPSVNKSALAIKQESIENKDSFSLSDLASGVISSSETSADSNTIVSKGSKKGKLSKNNEQTTDKGKSKIARKSKKDSVGKTTEKEHIILKLHLPQSQESTKHKKHHHHHHHHHKHRHSSSSHDDGSPRKSHHKKTVAKLSEDAIEPDGNHSSETKKNKKISIKFKGLSSKNIDLEMAADSPGLMQSAELDAAESSEAKSAKHSKESVKKKKKSKQGDLSSSQTDSTGVRQSADLDAAESSEAKSAKHSKESVKKKKKSKQGGLSSSQSESEHVKLVIKKDKLPSGSKSEVKKKKSSQPTTVQAKTGDPKKKTAATTPSKKGKGGATPVKSPQGPPQVCF